jgi:hypothetical protein
MTSEAVSHAQDTAYAPIGESYLDTTMVVPPGEDIVYGSLYLATSLLVCFQNDVDVSTRGNLVSARCRIGGHCRLTFPERLACQYLGRRDAWIKIPGTVGNRSNGGSPHYSLQEKLQVQKKTT